VEAATPRPAATRSSYSACRLRDKSSNAGDYLPLFRALTDGGRARRIIFFNSSRTPAAPGCVLRRYETCRPQKVDPNEFGPDLGPRLARPERIVQLTLVTTINLDERPRR
jgi:hypothetical protein